jgi:hypothetical protein
MRYLKFEAKVFQGREWVWCAIVVALGCSSLTKDVKSGGKCSWIFERGDDFKSWDKYLVHDFDSCGG